MQLSIWKCLEWMYAALIVWPLVAPFALIYWFIETVVDPFANWLHGPARFFREQHRLYLRRQA